jgi:hypothetical protein
MVTVSFRWIVADQMQEGRPAANTIAFDFPHTGNGFVQKPLRNHKIISFPNTTQTEPWRPGTGRSKCHRSSPVERMRASTHARMNNTSIFKYQKKEYFIRHDNDHSLHSYSFVE